MAHAEKDGSEALVDAVNALLESHAVIPLFCFTLSRKRDMGLIEGGKTAATKRI